MKLVQSFPADLKASIFIVLHTSPVSPGLLPDILTRKGALIAVHPLDNEKFKPGQIYIAPPDHHLLLERGRVVVKKGPKENHFRPSIDALFRSAAYVYGTRVIGVVLTGMLNDGTSGLWSIKRMGGIAIIQDPDDALFPSMPENVLEHVEVDYVAPLDKLGDLLIELVSRTAPKRKDVSAREMKLLKMEVIIATHDNAFEMGIMNMGKLTPYTCPECNGALIGIAEGTVVRFRCHTGHAFTASNLLEGITKTVEERLWDGMRGMEETNMLLKHLGEHYKKAGNSKMANRFFRKAKEIAKRARIIHDSVLTQQLLSEDVILHQEQMKKPQEDA
jgi:two-component system chemotaxis response regulator CheB